MDRLDEHIDLKTGRKVYQYYDKNGTRGRIVSRRRDLIELQSQGKLIHLSEDDVKFNTKRKRSNNIEVASPLFSGSGSNQENSNSLIIEQNVQKEQEYDPTTGHTAAWSVPS